MNLSEKDRGVIIESISEALLDISYGWKGGLYPPSEGRKLQSDFFVYVFAKKTWDRKIKIILKFKRCKLDEVASLKGDREGEK